MGGKVGCYEEIWISGFFEYRIFGVSGDGFDVGRIDFVIVNKLFFFV